jgi:hypothetical protein
LLLSVLVITGVVDPEVVKLRCKRLEGGLLALGVP